MLGVAVTASPLVDVLVELHNTSDADAVITNPTDDNDDGLEPWARVLVKAVCCTVAVLGGAGNLLTLCAVPYASRCCRAPLEVKRLRYSTATVFILNLAVADLMYCLVNLPLYYSQYNNPEVWQRSPAGCIAAAVTRHTNAAADWMSLAGIALNRCICLLNFKWEDRIFGGRKSYVIIMLIWIYGYLAQVYGECGWNPVTGKCDFLDTSSWGQPRTVWFLITWTTPCVIIILSYSLIFIKVKKSGRSIITRNNSITHVLSHVKTREDKTARMIFVVFVAYCMCVLPITIINIADPHIQRRNLTVVFYCVYWLQYCCNNVIYVLSNRVYRQAYAIFLTDMFPPLRRFLRQPARWVARPSTVTTISCGGGSDPARRLRHTDSAMSGQVTSGGGGGGSCRGGTPSSPSVPGSSDSPGIVVRCPPHRPLNEAPRRPPCEAPRRPPSEASRQPPSEAPRRPPCEAPRRPPREAPRRPPIEAPRRGRKRELGQKRLAGRRRSLPLERKVGPLPVWRALGGYSWLWYDRDDGTTPGAEGVVTGSERRPKCPRWVSPERERAMSL